MRSTPGERAIHDEGQSGSGKAGMALPPGVCCGKEGTEQPAHQWPPGPLSLVLLTFPLKLPPCAKTPAIGILLHQVPYFGSIIRAKSTSCNSTTGERNQKGKPCAQGWHNKYSVFGPGGHVLASSRRLARRVAIRQAQRWADADTGASAAALTRAPNR